MTNSNAQQKYLEASISTVSKEDLIVKIFDALILFSSRAIETFEKDAGDVEGIHNSLLRAQRACCLLMGALDMEIGGELSKNLFRIYEFWHHELVMANMKKEPSRIKVLLPTFKDFRETWMEAIARFKTQQRLSGAAAGQGGHPASDPGMASFAAVG
jgi:flagellar protein FliS